jgi:hypothetical protein
MNDHDDPLPTAGNPPAVNENDPLKGHVQEVLLLLKEFGDARTDELVIKCEIDHVDSREASIKIEIQALSDRLLHFQHLDALKAAIADIQEAKRLEVEIEAKMEGLWLEESKAMMTLRTILPENTNIWEAPKEIDPRDLI